MINARVLGVLVVAAGLALAGVFYMQRSDQNATAGAGKHFPDLIGQANQVAKVRIEVGEGPITLVKGESQWTVEQKGNYPASPVEIRALILGLAELTRIERKTSNPQLHAKLGLAENDPQKKAMLIRLEDENEKEILAVMIGKHKPAGAGGSRGQYYVRAPADPQVWLTEGKLPTGRTAATWIDNRMLGVEQDDIQSVDVTHGDGEQLRVHRKAKTDKDFELTGLSADEKVESVYSVNNIPRTLQSLAADDVIPISAIKLDSEPVKVQIRTFSGAQINIALFKQDDKVYARLASAGPINKEQPEPVTQDTGALDVRWRQWVYVIPEHQYDAITVKKTDLVKTKDSKPEPTG